MKLNILKYNNNNIAIVILGTGQVGLSLLKEYTKINKNGNIDIYHNSVYIISGKSDGELFSEISQLSQIYDSVFVINTIAITNTRKSEKNIIDSLYINAYFPLNLAEHIKRFSNTHLLHISTGCIFNGGYGTNGFEENDNPTPLIYYSSQKLQSEDLRNIKKEHIIIRPRMIFSELKIESNIINKVYKFTKVIDEENSMTSVNTIYKFIKYCIELILNNNEDIYGTYNLCNFGTSSAKKIKDILNMYCKNKMNYEVISKESLMELIKTENGLSSSFELTNTIINSGKAEKIFNRFNDSISNVQNELEFYCKEYCNGIKNIGTLS